MTAPDGKIRIPLNEEAAGGGQIEEFLMKFNGEGIEHRAGGSAVTDCKIGEC
jgi:4-hydroxyphenylpyruvate dioxygenase